ncbi:MAG: aldo/keto reductase [Devosia sp.]
MAEDVPAVPLRDGNLIPQLGYGTWQIPNADCPRIIGEAITAGYRSFDTAQGYRNEEGLGRAIRESGIAPSAFFVTSKLRNATHTRDLALRSFDETMKRLGIDQIDLFLIHWPVPAQDKYVEAWKTLIELQQQGHIRSIGVANFERVHMERLIAETGVTPAVNQIELHPLFQQREWRGYHLRRNIRIASASPLGPGTSASAWWWTHGRSTPGTALLDPSITAIAKAHKKTPAQIIIRWHLQEGLILQPRSTRADRMAENINVFDFTLTAEDVYRIEALDRPDHGRIGVAPSEWNVMT